MTHTANGNSSLHWLVHILATVMLATALAACASSMISYNQLTTLNKGMTPAETAVALKQPPTSVHEVEQGGKLYTFHRYTLYNSIFSDLYLLCFEQGKLKYWGYLEEFRRHPDPNINQAAEKAFDLIIETRTR